MDAVPFREANDSISLIESKIEDECLSQSTIILKDMLAGRNVKFNNVDGVLDISVKELSGNPLIENYSELEYDRITSTQRILNNITSNPCPENIERLKIRQEELFIKYIPVIEGTEDIDYTWVDMFEYNWLNQFDFTNDVILLPTTTSLVTTTDEITYTPLNRKVLNRQNKYYGIDSNGYRKHHRVLLNEFKYTPTHKLSHGNVYHSSIDVSAPCFFTASTKDITNNTLTDGLDRVVVPPGVAFNTYKAIYGVHSLYNDDVYTRRPDEYHYVVDKYGNILGEMNLPVPGVTRLYNSLTRSDTPYSLVDETTVNDLVYDAWDYYYTNNYLMFGDTTRLNTIHNSRLANEYYTLPTPCNDETDDIISASETCFRSHTYINTHHSPIWVDVNIFAGYLYCNIGDVDG
jgi:hypothetical protein